MRSDKAPPPPKWASYALALALPAATFALRLAAGYGPGDPPFLIAFVIPIMLCAYVGGVGPGLVATAVSALGSAYLLIAPTGLFAIPSTTIRVQWLVLVAIGLVSSGLIELLRRARGESVEAANLLRESEVRYRALFKYAPDGILIADARGRYLDANASIGRMLGYAREELIGKQAADITIQSEHEHIEPALSTIKASNDYYREWRFRRKDGSVLEAEVIATLMPDGNIMAMFRDVAERHRVEQALRERDAATEASRMKSQFVASMSHELRTPLNAIIGFTGMLLMKLPGPINPEQEKQLSTVQHSAKHLLALINDLLDVAKIESGKLDLELAPLDCGEAIESVVDTLRPMATAKGLDIVADLPPGGLMVEGDWRALSQILINLANNAIKFTERGSVRVEARHGRDASGNLAEISVVDTGIGIAPQEQPKLFQAFVQAEAGKRRIEGTGLGLYLCRKLAELQGGEIRFQSELGKGSRFTLALPEVRAPEARGGAPGELRV